MKLAQIGSSPSSRDLLFESRLLAIVTIVLEYGTACWILGGIKAGYCRIFTLWLFALFAFASSVWIVQGKSSCGCFGALKLSPWVSLFVDFCAIAIVYLFGDEFEKPKAFAATRNWRSVRCVSSLCLFICLLTVTFISLQQLKISTFDVSTGEISGDGFVLLKPADWIGKQLPIVKYLPGLEKELNGNVMLIFVRKDCDACHEYLKKLESKERDFTLVFVEVPSNGPDFVDNPYIWFELPDTYDWFVETPAAVRVIDGSIVGVRMGH